jgi:hypothetical protein
MIQPSNRTPANDCTDPEKGLQKVMPPFRSRLAAGSVIPCPAFCAPVRRLPKGLKGIAMRSFFFHSPSPCVDLPFVLANQAHRFRKSDHTRHQNTAAPVTSPNPSAISVMPLMIRSTGRNSGQSKSNSSAASRSARSRSDGAPESFLRGAVVVTGGLAPPSVRPAGALSE